MNCLKVSMVLVAISLAAVQTLSIPEVANWYQEVSSEKKCVCMNWRYCDGQIDPNGECHPSYVMACCIQPDPEPIPPYNGDEDVKKIDDDTPKPSEDEIKLVLVP